jgi:hypothetical protein
MVWVLWATAGASEMVLVGSMHVFLRHVFSPSSVVIITYPAWHSQV